MTTASISWRIEELTGRQQGLVRVHETSESTGESRTYVMPGRVVESFIKARRAFVAREMSKRGGIRLFTS